MELLHTAQGKIWIHYENPPVFVEKIRNGFPELIKGCQNGNMATCYTFKKKNMLLCKY